MNLSRDPSPDSCPKSKSRLEAENAALRHQLTVLRPGAAEGAGGGSPAPLDARSRSPTSCSRSSPARVPKTPPMGGAKKACFAVLPERTFVVPKSEGYHRTMSE